ncbi:MAG: hypothetical protein HZB67_00880 [Candidatus Aenigmarchaeota archaeon]|nr:hypothetical protein [Candidatus Aenigmarchaeota archaeon]
MEPYIQGLLALGGGLLVIELTDYLSSKAYTNRIRRLEQRFGKDGARERIETGSDIPPFSFYIRGPIFENVRRNLRRQYGFE